MRHADAPEWLRAVPSDLLQPTNRGCLSPHQSRQLCRWLADRGLPRPTLWQLECERLRRGMRSRLDRPSPARDGTLRTRRPVRGRH